MRILVLALLGAVTGCLTEDHYVEPKPPKPPELCNGIDDDNDPTTLDGADEPALGAPCDGPDDDKCSEGTTVCRDGLLVCNEAPSDNVELCNGKDDDCDGKVDEDYDLTTDPANCGFCGHLCENANGPTGCADSVCAPTCAVGAEDCNGNPDDGCEVFRDRNPTCADVVEMGGVSGDSGNESIEFTGTDETIVLVTLTENSTGTVPITATFDLDAPPGVDFDLYVYCGDCHGAIMGSSQHGPGVRDEVLFRHEDTDFANDDQQVYVEVRFVSATTCGAWDLKVTGRTAVPSTTCGEP